MIRPPLEHVELPLVDHFMRESADEFLCPVRRFCQQGCQQGKERRISRLLADLFARHAERGPARLTNMPTEAVSRLLHTTAIGGSAPSKYRVFRSRQIAVSCETLSGTA